MPKKWCKLSIIYSLMIRCDLKGLPLAALTGAQRGSCFSEDAQSSLVLEDEHVRQPLVVGANAAIIWFDRRSHRSACGHLLSADRQSHAVITGQTGKGRTERDLANSTWPRQISPFVLVCPFYSLRRCLWSALRSAIGKAHVLSPHCPETLCSRDCFFNYWSGIRIRSIDILESVEFLTPDGSEIMWQVVVRFFL